MEYQSLFPMTSYAKKKTPGMESRDGAGEYLENCFSHLKFVPRLKAVEKKRFSLSRQEAKHFPGMCTGIIYLM